MHFNAFHPRCVTSAKYVIVTTDPLQEGVVLVDVVTRATLDKGLRSGEEERLGLPKGGAFQLPRRIQLVCQAGRWFMEKKAVGGVDGAYHENEQRIFFEQQHDGNILVDFYRKTVSGLFFKDTFERHDKLLFQKIQDNQ